MPPTFWERFNRLPTCTRLRSQRGAALQREIALLARLRQGLLGLNKVKVYTEALRLPHTPVLICNIDGMRSEDVGAILDGDYDIAVRAGLHCAPLIHADLGTEKQGAIRFSPGPFATREDIDRAVSAMADIVRLKHPGN
jgi:selenocysteine lyase/cysteine desulfurase